VPCRGRNRFCNVRSYDTLAGVANGTKGQDTKQALLEAAKQLVGERGYAGTTVRELAAASGTNLAAVNYHFGSRERLLNQAVLESFLDWADQVGEISAIDPDAGGLEQLAARARPALEIFPEVLPKFVMALEALLQAQRSPELKQQLIEHYAELRRRIGEFIRSSSRGGELPDRMVEVVASYMLAVFDGLLLQSLIDPQAVPTGDELAALYEGLAATARAEALDSLESPVLGNE
jgi:AcrR family transcriptional regulator